MSAFINRLEMHKQYAYKLHLASYSIIFFMLVYFAALLFSLDGSGVKEAIKKVPLALYSLLFILSLISYTLRFIRWYFYLSPLRPEITMPRHLLIYLSGFALTTTPGKAGETVRSLYLLPLGIRYHQSLAAFFSERLLDIIAVVLLTASLFSWAFPEYQEWLVVTVILIMTIFVVLKSKFTPVMIVKFLRHRSKSSIVAFQNHIGQFLGNRSMLIALPLSLLAWAVQGYGLYLVVDGLGFDTSPLLIIGIYNASILAGAISFIPGGIGATEAVIAVLLASVGMDLPLAVVASIVCRGMTLWLAVTIGMIAMLSLNGTYIRE
jgi:uncharacterized protein (TIRG00374 family)